MRSLIRHAGLGVAILIISVPGIGSPRDRAADYDGLYYLRSPPPEDPYDYRLVLAHDGKPVPPKHNDPDEPTQPGFYRRLTRYRFQSIHIRGHDIDFQTASVKGVSYTFVGHLGSTRDPDFEDAIPFMRGTLSELHNGRLVRKRRLTFGHAVEY